MAMTPLTEEELRLLADSSDGKGTSASNRWARNRWRSWAASRSEHLGVDEFPGELSDVPLDDLVPALTRFFTEIQDCSGNPFSKMNESDNRLRLLNVQQALLNK